MTRSTATRLLAIDPTTKGFAWALLEGADTLVDWGTAQVRGPKNEACLKRAAALIACYRPHLIVMEDCAAAGARRSERVAALIRDIGEYARRSRIRCRRVPRKRVQALLGPQAATKYQVALAVAERFPELRSRLPRVRKPWNSEDERMSIFDALALALVALALSDSKHAV